MADSAFNLEAYPVFLSTLIMWQQNYVLLFFARQSISRVQVPQIFCKAFEFRDYCDLANKVA